MLEHRNFMMKRKVNLMKTSQSNLSQDRINLCASPTTKTYAITKPFLSRHNCSKVLLSE